jgi:hypothetical protein
MMEDSDGRTGPLLRSDWLDAITRQDLRAALPSKQNLRLGEARCPCFMRTIFDPRVDRTTLIATVFSSRRDLRRGDLLCKMQVFLRASVSSICDHLRT